MALHVFIVYCGWLKTSDGKRGIMIGPHVHCVAFLLTTGGLTFHLNHLQYMISKARLIFLLYYYVLFYIYGCTV